MIIVASAVRPHSSINHIRLGVELPVFDQASLVAECRADGKFRVLKCRLEDYDSSRWISGTDLCQMMLVAENGKAKKPKFRKDP